MTNDAKEGRAFADSIRGLKTPYSAGVTWGNEGQNRFVGERGKGERQGGNGLARMTPRRDGELGRDARGMRAAAPLSDTAELSHPTTIRFLSPTSAATGRRDPRAAGRGWPKPVRTR